MQIFSSLCILCLNLVINTEVAQSYLLLTANIEDIKTIAKKFGSQSIADQVVDFIAKVISKEHGTNANNVQDLISDAIYKNNLLDKKPEYEKKDIKTKNKKHKKENKDSLSRETNKHSDSEITTKNQWKNLNPAKNIHQKYKDSKDQYQPYKYNKPKENYDIKHNKKWDEVPSKIETSTERENTVYKEKRNQYRFEIKSKNLRTAIDDSDNYKQISNNKDKEDKVTTNIGYEVDRASVEITTERIPDSELDYEN